MKRIAAILLTLLALAIPSGFAFAAIAFDSTSDTAQVGGSGNVSWSFTNTAGNLLMAYAKGDGCTGCSDPTATYNGVSMTLANVGGYRGTTNTGKIWIFYLVSPATGAHTLAITQGATKATFFYGSGISYSGANTSTPLDTNSNCTNNPAGTATITTTATTVGDNDWSILFSGSENTSTAGTGSTQRLAGNGGFASYIYDSNGAITPPASHSMSVNTTAATNACMYFIYGNVAAVQTVDFGIFSLFGF